MARAKRIDRDRAEARRRYRTATATASSEPLDDEEPGDATDAAPAARGTAPGSGGAAGSRARTGAQPLRARMGFREAFTSSYRPVRLREDIAGLPAMLRHWSVWGVVAISIVSSILALALGPTSDVAAFPFSLFVAPGAVAGIFIAGYFAPTASYLAGLIVGLASGILYSLVVVIVASGAVPGGAGSFTPDLVGSLVLQAFLINALYGLFLAPAAAWYKRFLANTAPQRQVRPTAQTGKQRRTGPRAKTR